MVIKNLESFLLNIGFEILKENEVLKMFEIDVEDKRLNACVFSNNNSIVHIRKNSKICDFKEILFKSNLVSQEIYDILCIMDKLDEILKESPDNRIAERYYMIGEEYLFYYKNENYNQEIDLKDIQNYIEETKIFLGDI